MASARGNNKDGLSEYELEREARIARNKRRLEALKIPSMSIEVAKGPSRKKTKVCGQTILFVVAFGTLYRLTPYSFFHVENS